MNRGAASAEQRSPCGNGGAAWGVSLESYERVTGCGWGFGMIRVDVAGK